MYSDEEEMLEDLINMNLTREKTMEQKAREASNLLKVEEIKARKRMLLTQNNNTAKELSACTNSPTLIEKGRAKEIVAEKVGLSSHREVDRALYTVRKIDELKSKEDEVSKEKAKILTDVLNNRSPSASDILARKIDDLDFDN